MAYIHDVAEGGEFVVVVVRQGMGDLQGFGRVCAGMEDDGERVDHMAWQASCSRW